MTVYMKLLAMEVRRFRFPLAGIMLYTLLVEWIVLAQMLRSYAVRLRPRAGTQLGGGVPQPLTFADAIGNSQRGFALAVAIPFAVLLAYVLIIWYRDWFGKQPFIYRQLMVPGGRTPMYFAKLTAILLFIFAMLAWQLLLMPVLQLEYAWLAPAWLKEDSLFTDAMYASRILEMLLPLDFATFAARYGIGIWLVLLVFTGILLERSYRIRGLILAIFYMALNFIALGLTSSRLYPYEARALMLTIYGLEVAVAIWLSLRLINRKVSV
ncbi:hypothetical protein [Cohnella sp. 56]|uniref:hypothetical protein n=1 Tax=Cohnella sp. 56 TaxID=3113722 RepID=UPI0030E7E213